VRQRFNSSMMHRTKQALVALALVAVAASVQAQTAADFAQRRTVLVPSGEGLLALPLDEAVYRAAQTPDLRDLRVFNSAGEALPWTRLPAPPTARPAPVVLPLVVLPAEAQPRDALLNDFRLRIEKSGPRATIELTPVPSAAVTTAAAGASPRSDTYLIDARGNKGERGELVLQFAPGAPGFAGRVELQGSEDLVEWRLIASGPLVFSQQFAEPFERNVLTLPAVPSFLRVQTSHTVNPTGPLLSGANFIGAATATAPLRSALAVTTESASVFVVELPVGLPATRLHVRAARDNVAVRARLLRHDDDPALPRARLGLQPRRAPERWQPFGVIDVFRLDRNGAMIENSPVPLPPRINALRIELLDGATFGGELPIVEVEWQPERIAFAARAPGPYTLAVGLAEAKPGPQLAPAVLPADDPAGTRLQRAQLEPLAPLIATGGGVLGSATAPASTKSASAPRLLLWALLLGAVALLAAMAWQLGRQLQRGGRAPEAQGEQSTQANAGSEHDAQAADVSDKSRR
jgi:hypothetical protein